MMGAERAAAAVKKLTTALECIRYGLSPGETLAYVGGRTQ